MAETTVPSVRGLQRWRVAGILLVTGTAAGGLAGLVIALVLGPPLRAVADGVGSAGASSTAAVAALIVVGAGLDATRLAAGRPSPPTVGRQVPREWARLLPLPVAAALYGARLGVGPLTILSTWTWWSFTLAATLLGPLVALAAGATFGLAKLTAIVAVSQAAGPIGHERTFGRLRRGRRRSWAGLTALTVAVTLAAAACGSPGSEVDESAPGLRSRAADADAVRAAEVEIETAVGTQRETETDDHASAELIVPAELEDMVRTPTDDATTAAAEAGLGPDPTGAEATAAAAPDPDPDPAPAAGPGATDPLGGDLVVSIAGYEPIDGPDADRPLDLRDAAGIQPDPTEETALLETRGFAGGWLRAFRNEHNDVAVASVYAFRDETEAEFYLEDGLITIGGYGGTFFDIPELPGVRGFAQEIDASDGEATDDLVSLGAAFHRGDRWYLLYFLGSADRVTPEVLVPAIAAQVAAADA